ncbi:MAG: LLM class flavin-dependent oxidoreductase [Alphaproteobacteria bacterium]|nr:LLM class flavin-dependent oxidoreductase [Alphaproteobacteria bacterium]MCB9928220.1 LLM class flavin-dependent oxidoreductase [Alphaproteobacteria bacterium]
MKLGLYMATQWPKGAEIGPEIAHLCEQARAARDNGFETVMVGQHFLTEPLQMLQAEPLIARLAGEATGLELGIAVVLLPMMSPVLVAEYAASLDWLAGGKYILGLGVGYRPEEFQGLGAPMESRGERFEEALHVMKRLWSEDVVTHAGKHYCVPGVGASIRPVRPEGPTVWIGGEAPPAVRRAGRLGHPWVIAPSATFEGIRARTAIYETARIAAGHPPPARRPVIRECVIGATRQQALDTALPSLLGKYEAYASWGQKDANSAGFRERFDTFMAERFLVGDEAEVADQMARYRDELGIDQILVRVQWPGLEQRHVLAAMERVGRVAARLN